MKNSKKLFIHAALLFTFANVFAQTDSIPHRNPPNGNIQNSGNNNNVPLIQNNNGTFDNSTRTMQHPAPNAHQADTASYNNASGGVQHNQADTMRTKKHNTTTQSHDDGGVQNNPNGTMQQPHDRTMQRNGTRIDSVPSNPANRNYNRNNINNTYSPADTTKRMNPTMKRDSIR